MAELNWKLIIYTIVAALVITALLQGFKQTALKSAYDAASATTVNDSAGVVHTVAASPISGDTTAVLYSVAQGLVWLFAIVVILFSLFKGRT